MSKVAIIDMGMGNIRSLVSALSFLGVDSIVSNSVTTFDDATHILLPGVGAYDAAMSRLRDLSLIDPIRSYVLEQDKPILGICLGMQLLCESSEEGDLPGLNLVPGRFIRLKSDLDAGFKVPHVGFSEIHGYKSSGLFEGLADRSYFYFTHSYALMQSPGDGFHCAYCGHTQEFVAAFQQGVISGTQFHPEKSQSSGLRMLRNFIINTPVTTTSC